MIADTTSPHTETEPLSPAPSVSILPPSASTDSRWHVRASAGNRLPLTRAEGADMDAVRCPYCNLPMFTDRAQKHCTHCDWLMCPACHRWYSRSKAPAHEIEE